MRTCDAALLVLRETGNPAVMWGDTGLLDLIVERAGIRRRPCDPPTVAQDRVLANLSRQPGELVAGRTLHPHSDRRRVRIFWLREHAPARALDQR